MLFFFFSLEATTAMRIHQSSWDEQNWVSQVSIDFMPSWSFYSWSGNSSSLESREGPPAASVPPCRGLSATLPRLECHPPAAYATLPRLKCHPPAAWVPPSRGFSATLPRLECHPPAASVPPSRGFSATLPRLKCHPPAAWVPPSRGFSATLPPLQCHPPAASVPAWGRLAPPAA